MRGILLVAGLLLLAVAAGGCTAGTRSCVTHYATCRAEQAGETGYPCLCRYPDYTRAGIYQGGE